MLSPSEKTVLKAVLSKCGERSKCLATAADILCRVPRHSEISESRLNDILKCLEYDGYVDVVMSDRHGEMVYCISLKERGKGYKRESVQSRRYVLYRFFLAILSAFITFAIGRLLFAILK
ncbi:MAG: hypothetical protein IJV67_02820 [Clostridia bacterium]|nr:hypothetical protein [Clostridia bacterium]MBR2968275.1 hypothetical protein [Clostridia bacterium]